MKSSLRTVLVATIGTAILLGTPNSSFAQEKEKEKGKEKSEEKAKKSGALPFNGKAAAVDKAAKTITLSGKSARVLQVTAATKVSKDGKPATLEDVKEGEDVSGAYKTNTDGKLEATTLNIGPKPPAKSKDKKDEKKDEKK